MKWDDLDRDRLVAGAKIAGGAAKMAGAIVTGTGHGLVGTALRDRHQMTLAARLAVHGFKSGMQLLKQGVADWKECHLPPKQQPREEPGAAAATPAKPQ